MKNFKIVFVLLVFVLTSACSKENGNLSSDQLKKINDADRLARETKKELSDLADKIQGNSSKDETTPSAQPSPAAAQEKAETDTTTTVSTTAIPSPYYLAAYGEPNNADFSALRRELQKIDASPDLKANRQREFTTYPYTVQIYILSLKPDDAKQIKSIKGLFPRLSIVYFPLRKIQVQSYITLRYTKPYFGGVTEKMFWIGNSQEIDVTKLDFPNLNLANVPSYLPYMMACAEISGDCINTLLTNGYFQENSTIDKTRQSPFQFMRRELAESAYLRDLGYQGTSSITGSGAFFKANFDRKTISDITLSHDVWVSNEGDLNGQPSSTFFKLAGYDHRGIAAYAGNGVSYFKLPVEVPPISIPSVVRNHAPPMGVLTMDLLKAFDNYVPSTQQLAHSQEPPQSDSTLNFFDPQAGAKKVGAPGPGDPIPNN